MPGDNNIRSRINRRSVLKTMGVGTIALSAGPVGRSAALSKEQFEGIVYDPVKKRILGPGYGSIARKDGTLNGHLLLDGSEYSLETSIRDTSGDGRTGIFIQRSSDAVLDLFSTKQSAISGLLTQSRDERVAFYLGSLQHGMNPDTLRETITKWQPTKIVQKKGESPQQRGGR